jgi:hypothetical protein
VIVVQPTFIAYPVLGEGVIITAVDIGLCEAGTSELKLSLTHHGDRDSS